MKMPSILIVEDEILIRMTAVLIVEEAGYRTVEAANSEEAIAVLEHATDIAAVFTDVNMPGSMSGTELASRIRDRWPPIQLLVTSGKRHVDAGQLPAGAVFIAKPYDIDDVVDTLHRLSPRQFHDQPAD